MPRKRVDPVEQLMQIDERTRRRKEFVEQLKSRTWLESEVREWKDEIIRDPEDAILPLEAFTMYLERARRENRYRDDISPTWANISLKTTGGAWAVRTIEISMLSEYATFLDRREIENMEIQPKTLEALDRLHSRMKNTEAAGLLMTALALSGRVANENHFGIMAREAVPMWIDPVHFERPMLVSNAGQISRLARDGEIDAEAQRARFDVWERSRRLLLEAMRTSRNADVAFAAVPWRPGFGFEPLLPGFSEWARYRNETRYALEWLQGHSTEIANMVARASWATTEKEAREAMQALGIPPEEVEAEIKRLAAVQAPGA